MVDFRQFTSMPMDDIKRPPALPPGTYNALVAKHEYGESSEKKTPFIRYHYNLISAEPDVDATQLEGIDVQKRSLTQTFYMTPDSFYRVKEHLEKVGIKTDGRSLGECVPEYLNMAVKVRVEQQPNRNDPTAPPRNEISEAMAA
jgi:hypothetical protein